MILVINLNASLDKRYELVDFAKGKIVRAKSVDNTPGGKGIHVANVDTILGEDTVVTGFLGGKTGEFVAGRLYDYGISGDFVVTVKKENIFSFCFSYPRISGLGQAAVFAVDNTDP